ncbi:hypothetical protein HK104_007743 [Borealophlyctis nickersoniae]|nr:hypothetical protein HK104_007743 [Borealophlyctis nickersoniae]
MSSDQDQEIDIDVEEEIRRELEQLGTLDNDNDGAGNEDADEYHQPDSVASVHEEDRVGEESNEEDGLHRMSSWQDYLDTIASRANDTLDFLDEHKDEDGPKTIVAEKSTTASGGAENTSYALQDTGEIVPVGEIVGVHGLSWEGHRVIYAMTYNGKCFQDKSIERQLELEEQELAERLKDLHAKTASEEALLDALHAEAAEAGIPTGGLTHDAPKISVSAVEGAQKDAEASHTPVAIVPAAQQRPTSKSPQLDPHKQELLLYKEEERLLVEELHSLVSQQRDQAGEHGQLHYRLDCFRTRRAVAVRGLRQTKEKLRELQAKERQLYHIITVEAKATFDREKDRSALLIAKAQAAMAKQAALRDTLIAKMGVKKQRAETVSGILRQITGETKELSGRAAAEEAEIAVILKQVEEEAAALEVKKAQRDDILLSRLHAEEAARHYELSLLIRAAKSQKPNVQVEMDEIEVLKAPNAGLRKIPNLKEAVNIRHINFDNNLLSSTRGLDVLKNLKTLSLNGNHYAVLNVEYLTKLRALFAASNQIGDIENLSACDHLQLLDVSYNPLTNCEFLTPVVTLQVLLMRSTKVKDITYISSLRNLIYLDLSANNLYNVDLRFLAMCPLLQGLTVAENLYTETPVVPCTVLNEIDLSSNKIKQLNITTWTPTLRVIDISNNQLRQIEPLVMCPFLEELYAQNNFLTDFRDVYALSVCQSLRILDLRQNPVIHDRNFSSAAAILFESLRVLNGEELAKKSLHSSTNPLKIVKWCAEACEYLDPYLSNREDKDQKLQTFEDYHRIIYAQRRNITSFMGPAYRPYLQYISTQEGTPIDEDARAAFQLQEARLGWLTSMLQQNLSELADVGRHKPASGDIMLLPWLDSLRSRIKLHSIVYVQSLWRMFMSRRYWLKRTGASRLIQRCYRRYIVRKRIKEEEARVRKLEVDVRRVQSVWRGYRTRKWFATARAGLEGIRNERAQMRADAAAHAADAACAAAKAAAGELNATAGAGGEGVLGGDGDTYDGGRPSPSQSPGLPDLDDDPEMNEWLANANENAFDEEMDKYLGDESLVHFEGFGGVAGGREEIDGQSTERNELTGDDMTSNLRGYGAQVGAGRTDGSGLTQGTLFGDQKGLAKVGKATNARGDGKKPAGQKRSQLAASGDADGVGGHGIASDGGGNRADGKDGNAQSDAGADESDAWNLTNELSQRLWRKKKDRYAKLEKQARFREMMRDPLNRLRAFQRAHEGHPETQVPASNVHHGDKTVRKDRVIYAWDIPDTRGMEKPTESQQKAKETYDPMMEALKEARKLRVSFEFQFLLEMDSRKGNTLQTAKFTKEVYHPGHKSKGTLLVNNYVASKLQGPAPATFHDGYDDGRDSRRTLSPPNRPVPRSPQYSATHGISLSRQPVEGYANLRPLGTRKSPPPKTPPGVSPTDYLNLLRPFPHHHHLNVAPSQRHPRAQRQQQPIPLVPQFHTLPHGTTPSHLQNPLERQEQQQQQQRQQQHQRQHVSVAFRRPENVLGPYKVLPGIHPLRRVETVHSTSEI